MEKFKYFNFFIQSKNKHRLIFRYFIVTGKEKKIGCVPKLFFKTSFKIKNILTKL